MKRIYQGRVTKLELLDDAKKDPAVLKAFDSASLANEYNAS